jgi:hypothetical protein
MRRSAGRGWRSSGRCASSRSSPPAPYWWSEATERQEDANRDRFCVLRRDARRWATLESASDLVRQHGPTSVELAAAFLAPSGSTPPELREGSVPVRDYLEAVAAGETVPDEVAARATAYERAADAYCL